MELQATGITSDQLVPRMIETGHGGRLIICSYESSAVSISVVAKGKRPIQRDPAKASQSLWNEDNIFLVTLTCLMLMEPEAGSEAFQLAKKLTTQTGRAHWKIKAVNKGD